MVEIVSFRARARTVDHLGREQIADCPTAVSGLWKNAYDATPMRGPLPSIFTTVSRPSRPSPTTVTG